MSGSDKMEVDGGPPPLVFDDEDAKGQDAKTPDSEEKKKWRGRGGYERRLSVARKSHVSAWRFRGAKSQLLRSCDFCQGGTT